MHTKSVFCVQEGQPSERKLVKLCEYAGKNPIRIPKVKIMVSAVCVCVCVCFLGWGTKLRNVVSFD